MYWTAARCMSVCCWVYSLTLEIGQSAKYAYAFIQDLFVINQVNRFINYEKKKNIIDDLRDILG